MDLAARTPIHRVRPCHSCAWDSCGELGQPRHELVLLGRALLLHAATSSAAGRRREKYAQPMSWEHSDRQCLSECCTRHVVSDRPQKRNTRRNVRSWCHGERSGRQRTGTQCALTTAMVVGAR